MSEPASTPVDPKLQELLASYEASRRHTARAAATAFPGPLLRAFAVGPQRDGLREVCLGDFIILAELGHPVMGFVEAWIAGDQPEVPDMSQRQRDQAGCLWRVPWEAVVGAMRANGVDAFRGQSKEWLLSSEQICRHVLSGFSTGVRMKAPAGAGGVVAGNFEDGLGWWLRLWGFAVDGLGLSEETALGYPLCRLLVRRVYRDHLLAGLEFDGLSYTRQEEELRAAREAS